MASKFSSTFLLVLSYCLLILTSINITPSTATAASPSSKLKALFLPVKKDPSTLQYIAQIKQRTPSVSIKVALDLGSEYLWLACDDYVSSTYKPVHCGSRECSVADGSECGFCPAPQPFPGCNVNACYADIYSPFIGYHFHNELAQDALSMQSLTGQRVSVNGVVFSCAIDYSLTNISMGAKGMLGLGRNKFGLPSQLASTLGFTNKFAICLSPSSNGVVLFGDAAPHNFVANNVSMSVALTYVPLIQNLKRNPSFYYPRKLYSEYFIGLKSIKINGKAVPFDSSLLSITDYGYGGTRISTDHPYTQMDTKIYEPLVDEFVKAIGNKAPRVANVEPFGACFNSTGIRRTRFGPDVPAIDLVFKRNNVFWRIFGSNSMVVVSKDVLCLAFVDAGESSEPSAIVIGGHQLEDNLLEFDLHSNRLGFSSSLLLKQTTCSNFNFKNI